MALIRGKYHLLDFPLSEDWTEKLLGRVVVTKENPALVNRPTSQGTDENGFEIAFIPQQVFPGLVDKPVPYTNLNYLLKDFKDINQSAKVTEFFHQEASKAISTYTEIVSIEAERIDINELDIKLKRMMDNKVYKDAVQEILIGEDGKLRKLGLVVGVYISKSLTVTVGNKKETDVGGQAGIPVGAVAGIPTKALDVNVAAGFARGTAVMETSTISVPSVFAVAYTDIMLRPKRLHTPPPKQTLKEKLKARMSRKKRDPDVEYEAFIDTSLGTDFFFAGDSSSGSSDDEAEGRSTTSTHVAQPDQGAEIEADNRPHGFVTPATVFGT